VFVFAVKKYEELKNIEFDPNGEQNPGRAHE